MRHKGRLLNRHFRCKVISIGNNQNHWVGGRAERTVPLQWDKTSKDKSVEFVGRVCSTYIIVVPLKANPTFWSRMELYLILSTSNCDLKISPLAVELIDPQSNPPQQRQPNTHIFTHPNSCKRSWAELNLPNSRLISGLSYDPYSSACPNKSHSSLGQLEVIHSSAPIRPV